MTVQCIDVCKILCCFFLPPVAVGLERGWCTGTFWLNVILTILGWLPGRYYNLSLCELNSFSGQIHACFVVLIKPEDDQFLGNNTSSSQPAAASSSDAAAAPATSQPEPAKQPENVEKQVAKTDNNEAAPSSSAENKSS